MFGFLKNRKGQGMVEYILIIIVVVGIILLGYKIFGGHVKESFIQGGEKISSEANTAFADNNEQ